MRRRTRRRAGLVLTGLLLLAGCTGAGGTDDELAPRPTPTVTVTGSPQQRLPDRLDLSGPEDLSGAVVWALDDRLSVDGRVRDLAPVLPERLVVLPRGVLVLSDQQVWFVSGRAVRGLPLPPVTSLDVSRDGSQLVLTSTDRDEPFAYSVEGVRLDQGATGVARPQRRTVRGPGAYEVTTAGGSTRVVDARGGVVPVAGLPQDLDVRGWVSPGELLGVGRLLETPADDLGVVACSLGPQAACRAAGEVPRGRAGDLVLGLHPQG